jgi:hypothetical protein
MIVPEANAIPAKIIRVKSAPEEVENIIATANAMTHTNRNETKLE